MCYTESDSIVKCQCILTWSYAIQAGRVKQAMSRQKALEKMEPLDDPSVNDDPDAISFTFPEPGTLCLTKSCYTNALLMILSITQYKFLLISVDPTSYQ